MGVARGGAMRAVGVACNGNDVIIVVVVATGDGVEGES